MGCYGVLLTLSSKELQFHLSNLRFPWLFSPLPGFQLPPGWRKITCLGGESWKNLHLPPSLGSGQTPKFYLLIWFIGKKTEVFFETTRLENFSRIWTPTHDINSKVWYEGLPKVGPPSDVWKKNTSKPIFHMVGVEVKTSPEKTYPSKKKCSSNHKWWVYSTKA